MWFKFLKAILIMGVLIFAKAEAQVGSMVSQIVGQAGDQVVTSREVQIGFFVETALFPDDKKKQSLKLDIADKNFDKEVTHVLIEWIVYVEANLFNAATIPEDDIAKSVSVVKSAAQNVDYKTYWENLGASSQELRDIINRKLRAKKFIQFKTRASVVPVTDAEALQYFQKNRIRFGNAPFSQFKDSIKSLLAQEQANTRIRDWFELLQKKYRVHKVAVNGKSTNS